MSRASAGRSGRTLNLRIPGDGPAAAAIGRLQVTRQTGSVISCVSRAEAGIEVDPDRPRLRVRARRPPHTAIRISHRLRPRIVSVRGAFAAGGARTFAGALAYPADGP